LKNCKAWHKNQGGERDKKKKIIRGSQAGALFSTRATLTWERHQDESNDALK